MGSAKREIIPYYWNIIDVVFYVNKIQDIKNLTWHMALMIILAVGV